ncbi:aldolase/citrate lyase family protein [Limnobacter sp.]|uniref:HpcH/HpaI aldolase/citrate lyase family protein n=1 Tax=Limnobacter sp. TaxID=2003368 RepID=UPI00258D94DE|nr:aldolase/citrate lyase family protein [Limnobacter sp.]
MNNKRQTLDLQHIATVLYSEEDTPRNLPVCDHYAGKPRFFDKALEVRDSIGACFDITLDLEDGAEHGQVDALVQWAGESLQLFQARYGPEERRPGVRVHPFRDKAFELEIEALLSPEVPSPAYLMIPKPECAGDIKEAINHIQGICQSRGLEMPPIHALIETHGALAEVQEIASLVEVESLSFGIMDFVSGHRSAIPKSALNSPGQFENPLVRRAKLEISAACHRFGKVPSHNVSRQISQPEVAGEDAARAKRDFGYTRMWSIHPAQIVHIVSATLPSDSEVDEAVQVLTEAEKANWGPIQLKSELHDRASYRYFFEVLKQRNR